MKGFKLLYTVFLALTLNNVFAQLCNQDNRFTDAEFFSITEIDSLTNINYGTAINYQGVSQDLLIDYYFPNNAIDPMAERPFILLLHGGGFKRGSKEGHTTSLCKEFAKRGFVAATMSYRLGFDPTVSGDIAIAVYRAQQDTNAALRYTVKNADELKIDTSWIFIGGSSAGAIASLYTTYGSQEEWHRVLPALESKLGPLDSSGNNLEQTFTIRAIFNNYGAASPRVLSPGEKLIPMISFHGELDTTVPIDIGSKTGFGSRALHKMLNDQGVCNDFTIDPTGGHGVYYSEEGVKFSVGRAACFFKSLFCDTCSDFFSTETISASCSN